MALLGDKNETFETEIKPMLWLLATFHFSQCFVLIWSQTYIPQGRINKVKRCCDTVCLKSMTLCALG